MEISHPYLLEICLLRHKEQKSKKYFVDPKQTVAQEYMEQIIRNLQNETDIYIDAIKCFSKDWEHHVKLSN